jgi:cell division cycle protein 37
MKQRTLHEQRDMRNAHIAQLQADLALNAVLEPRVRAFAAELAAADDDAPALFSRTVERLKTSPDPASQGPGAEPYDTIIYHLLLTVYDDVKKAGVEMGSPKLAQALRDALQTHLEGLEGDTRDKQAKLADEQREKAKKITSEDVHEGFDSKYVPAKPEPAPIANAIRDPKGKGKQKETSIEVLNPGAASTPADAAAAADDADDADDDDLPQLTPSLVGFSKIGAGRFQQSYEYIQAHRDVIVAGASDALLVAAFDAQSNGRPKHAKQCVHQSLLVQYCEKLGGDGVRVFFMKSVSIAHVRLGAR